ncbi:DNA mismatch repair protein MutT [Altererythrobacter sp. B11]|uniref:NUDIX hydrolase n=1 Tax=Altererythrobacter sp. B11 TaxID=2060312 RepID=UPI000DC6DF8B|nr:NUDIX domain-containing protein [Altererythrobacter sp. B11]BBC72330.1 DNA mismatch repair protein MutT [Altererythrobacter sp. B11]
MTTWRPDSAIRVKAIGLHWRDGRLLAAEVLDDNGRLKGVRPLGGSVEFGETLKDAVIREFEEELGVCVAPLGSPHFFENIYLHEGATGHEILAVFDVCFPRGKFEDCERIDFKEAHGGTCAARWFDLDELDLDGRPDLYPVGLKAYLQSRGG